MNRQTKRFSLIVFSLISLCLGMGTRSALAQGNIRIVHTQEHESRADAPYLGRDLWFAIPQNADPNDHSQKYFNIYVNSPRNTTVNFQVAGGPIIKKPVTAGKVTIFTSPTPKFPNGDISVSTEITSSGVVETKSVHIWSDNADIAVYFLSRVPYTTDGMYVVPSTGWGKEYVVGAYSSLLVSQNLADYPSEFVVVANHNNTIVTIVPSYDLRRDGFPNVIQHPKGVPFTQNLNKGECVQYQATGAQTGEEDVTGTIITSNNPVGVIGASVCPFIRPDEPSCDYILDMLQPVRTWSSTYYTCPFAGRKYGGDGFLMIATANQTIYRNGSAVATLNKYGYLFLYDDTPTPLAQWTSTAPFMLVQYVCSSTHDAPNVGNRNQGDPAMVVINPADQFSKKVYFQTPTIDPASGQTDFTNYINILLPANHEGATTFDGKPIGGALPVKLKQKFGIPNTSWEAFRLTFDPGSGQGTHVVASDTGVGVYIYGYGTDDSYAWAGALGTKTPNDPDTIPPVAIADGPCFCAHVRIYDTGPGQSKLSSFILDSSYNMAFYPDPNFVPGAGMDSSYYDMCVIDSSLEAYLGVSIYDIAGNRTTVFSVYKPQFVTFTPDPLNFGSVNVGNTAFRYDTICNSGLSPFHFKGANLKLSNGQISDNLGFSIDSTGADGDIPVGGCRVVKIKFKSIFPPTVKDTMTIADECVKIPCPIIGNGGLPDFDVPDYSFDCTTLSANRPSINYFVTNPSGIDIQIDSVWLDDIINFAFNKPPNVLPFMVPNSNTASGQAQIIVNFNPQSLGLITTTIHVKAKGGAVKTAKVSGYGCMPDLTAPIGTATAVCGNPVNFKIAVHNIGTYYDSIISVRAGSVVPPGFSFIKLYDKDDNPLTLPNVVDSGEIIYATVDYNPPPKACGQFSDTIIIIGYDPETKKQVVAATTVVTATVIYSEATVTRDNVDYGNLPFGGAKVQDYFEVCNSGCDPMTISDVPQLSSPTPTGFTPANVMKVGGVVKTLPITLAAGECLDVYVDFNPAFSNVSNQTDSFGVVSNACNGNQVAHFAAAVSTGPPNVQGFNHPPLFSCDVTTDSVSLKNPNGSTTETITAVSIDGPDKANFSSVAAVPIVIQPNATARIPILFTPSQTPGQTTYNAIVILNVTDGAGSTAIDTAKISAIGQGVDITVTSKFATPSSEPGFAVSLPIQIAVDKHGLTTPLTDIDITELDLTYVYDMNILDILKNDIVGAVKVNVAGWSVDGPNSSINAATSTLQLHLVGTSPLKDADIAQPIASISFMPSVPKAGSVTDVALSASNFINSSKQPVPNCTAVQRLDSAFTLIYACGDSTLQKFMNGQNVALKALPVNPNPVGSSTGNVLSFKYAARSAGVISLAIYDELGKEVARPIDNQDLPAGSFEVRYNTSRLSEGTYVYRYSLNNKSVTSGRFVIQK
ncbi:MAG: T9SS type A sorting domain-containing protein [Bacteroidota bacterium]|nr:T9SS type A sorting domain-containing protein [Bacteroidota bacterium]